MTTSMKLAAGTSMPSLPVHLVSGGETDIAAMPGWRMLVVYRGEHCPLCKKYFKILDGMGDDFKAAGVSLLAVSADTREKVEADVKEQGWRFPVATARARRRCARLVFISRSRARARKQIGHSQSPACS